MKGETKGRLANLQRCTEETPEPGKKRLHRRNKAGVCLDCGDVSHRATWIKKLTFICVECSAVSVVTPDNRLRHMTEAELLGRRPASQKIIRNARAGD